MTSSPLVSVIIVSWNVSDALQRCLESIKDTKYPSLEVIVVDNDSADNSLEIANNFTGIKIQTLKNSSNLGFPAAVNQGLSMASGQYLLVLNPDIRLPGDFFKLSVEFFSKYSDVAIMGPKLVNPDGTPQGSVFPEPSIVNYIREFWFGNSGLTSKYTPSGDVPVMVNCIQGACMFFPRKTMETIGKFTTEVFLYYEDLDYCRRIRKSGQKVYFNPQITVVHEHGSSFAKSGGKAMKYLSASSLWYNGWLKYHFINFIIRSGRLFKS